MHLPCDSQRSAILAGTLGYSSASDAVAKAHVEQRLPAGKYCHALALERQHWEDLLVSPLEIQEAFARDVVGGKRAAQPRA